MTKLSDRTETNGAEAGLLPSLRPTTSVDVDYYQTLLNAPDLSANQRAELLQALWTIIICLVDLGFEVQPAQPTNVELEGK